MAFGLELRLRWWMARTVSGPLASQAARSALATGKRLAKTCGIAVPELQERA